MVQQPQIPGFEVRPVVLEDAAAWAMYACLPEVKEHTSSTVETVEDVRATIERILSSTPSLPTRFVVLAKGGSSLVATVGFHTVSLQNGTAEITYDVSPSHWGKGIATAACQAAKVWAFEAVGWHRVQATTLLSNVGSQRVLEKSGFKREGLVRNFRLVRGRPADYWLYSAIPGEAQSAA
jgi:[ribosomal protein S5]-alanine N-acetyltransferase